MPKNTKPIGAKQPNKPRGFTIVELLIVIVVIGVLVGIALIGYNGVQKQARETKIRADVIQLSDAIRIARQKSRMTLEKIDGRNWTARPCAEKPAKTDFAALPKTDECWTYYLSALKSISIASGVDVTDVTDPWGRPYAIDENEAEIDDWDPPGFIGHCHWDTVTAYAYPYTGNWSTGLYISDKIYPENLEPSGLTHCTDSMHD